MLFNSIFPETLGLLQSCKRIAKHEKDLTNPNIPTKIRQEMLIQLSIFKTLCVENNAGVPQIWNHYFEDLYKRDKFYCQSNIGHSALMYNQLTGAFSHIEREQTRIENFMFQFECSLLAQYTLKDQIFDASQYCVKSIDLRNFKSSTWNSLYLYEKFQEKQSEINANSVHVLSKIFKKVVALRMLESFETHNKNNHYNFNIDDYKFSLKRTLYFTLQFPKYVGNLRQWGKDFGQFHLKMLQQLETRFNVEFQFICTYNNVRQYIPQPFCSYFCKRLKNEPQSNQSSTYLSIDSFFYGPQ